MKVNARILLLSILVLFQACAGAQTPASGTVLEPETGISFPSRIAFSEGKKPYEMDLTGVTVRKKWLFKVYAIAHYIDKESVDAALKPQIILNDGAAKQITIEYLRKVSADRLTSVLREDFEHNTTPAEYQQIRPNVERVLDYFNQPVQKGDVFIMRWLPGGHVTLELNRKKLGEVQDVLFARTLWSIWFGEHAVVNPEALLVK